MAGKPSRGLADVVVAATAISDVDRRTGRLSYRGYDVTDLAGTATFEEVACLLQRGAPPGRTGLAGYRADLAAGQALGPVTRAALPAVARAQPPMAALRTLVSLASADEPSADEPASSDSGLRAAARLTGRQAALAGAVRAARDGAPPPEPDPGLGLAGNLLGQLTGTRPADRAAEIFDACLVLHADHVMSAATFAARVCAATGAGLDAAAAAAVAALGGPLHGGANEQVMHDLTVIMSEARPAGADPVEAAAGQARDRLRRGDRITGFGHRAYRGEDPRATVLRGLSAELAACGDDTWHRMALAVENVVWAERGLAPNADFYAAVVYHYLGIPPQWRAPVLSAARMAGWAAHILEQQADNRLIRPGSEYVGEIGLTWTPLADR